MEFTYNDGGRKETGFKGTTRDCVTRAIAIAAGMNYIDAYNLVNGYGKKEYDTKKRIGKSSARMGVHKPTIKRIMRDLGFHWVACMGIGTGCKVHLRKNELPSGVIIVNLSRHISVVKDGVLNDIYNCSRDETRCVYGYWIKNNHAQEIEGRNK